MSSRSTSNMNMHKATEYPPEPNLLQSPQLSTCKKEHARPSPYVSGVKGPITPELISNRKAPPLSPDASPRDQRRAFNYITMGRFQIYPTTTRVRVFTWLLLLSIEVVSILTAAAFWLATMIFISSMFDWNAPLGILCFALKYLEVPPFDTLWKHICLGPHRGPHLRLAVHASNYVNSPVICSTSIKILHEHPFIWLFTMAFMFISHCFACFARGCVSKLKIDNT